MDPSDNLNLVQPVNPWSGSSWSMYTEYFQWSPTHNSNSRQHSVEAGQTLHGQLTIGTLIKIWQDFAKATFHTALHHHCTITAPHKSL